MDRFVLFHRRDLWRFVRVFCSLIILVSLITWGYNDMAFWKEVTGKTRSKTLLIGDGVDKVHSPLQVEPQMATDMLNISSKLFPALSIRGDIESIDYLNDGYSANGSPVCICDPYIASNGDVHIAVLHFYETYSDGDYNRLIWYVLSNGSSTFTRIEEYDFRGNIPSETEADPEIYATANFSEYQGLVYMSLSTTVPYVGSRMHIYAYDPSTGTESETTTEEYALTVRRSNPTAVYLNRLFVGVDQQLKYSALYDPTDFATAYDSGSYIVTQGGIITSLTPMRDRLLVSTENSLFALFGSDFDTFSASLVTDTLGIKNPKCITEYNGIVYFIGSDGDVYEYTGNSLTNVSREPTQTGSRSAVRGGFPQGSLSLTSISAYNNKLKCVESSSKTIYEFDVVKRRWFIHKYSPVIAPPTTTYQIETTTVIGTITSVGGTAVTQIEAIRFYGGLSYSVLTPVELGDEASDVAGKIRTSLNADTTVTDTFVVSGADDEVILTMKDEPEDVYGTDPYFAVVISNGTCTGLTVANSVTTAPFIYNFSQSDMVVAQTNNMQRFVFWDNYDRRYSVSISNVNVLEVFSESETVASDTEFKWVSPAYQLNPTGRQALKAIHFTYYSPADSEIDVFVSNSVDGIDDFVNVATLHSSANKQNSRQVIGIRNTPMAEWVRIKLEGHGDIIIYNMTLEWRLLDRLM